LGGRDCQGCGTRAALERERGAHREELVPECACEFRDLVEDITWLEVVESRASVFTRDFQVVIEALREGKANAETLLDIEDRDGITVGHGGLHRAAAGRGKAGDC